VAAPPAPAAALGELLAQQRRVGGDVARVLGEVGRVERLRAVAQRRVGVLGDLDEDPGRADGRGGAGQRLDEAAVARGVPSGPHRAELGPIPLGPVWLRTPEKSYIDGESDDSDLDVVAWSVTWLPWPHVERDTVLGIFDEDAEDTIVAREGHRLVVRAGRETRSIVFGLSTSWVTWLGWIGVLLAVRRRRRADR
jgi:hypothetical protein